ncbi:PatB family C-S lyase [Roseomonas sp. GC11]|uniref:MalY/PatB family protein n=1 Tax=Roseomonas sp. GC11 TaxID=2950546 RepID=UPI00210B5982|nr:PatB family C-S lyase [Roseomonas sp. GC11]MCQ4160110.1 PatB family C-S lyase [Roseomonas sp. GC11]
MPFDFDSLPAPRGHGGNKWDRYPEDVIPLWVAAMDFPAPPAVLAALRGRLDHPVLDYGSATPALREAILAHLETRYGWRVEAEALVFLPGVEPGFNMALRAFLQPGEGVMVQTPAYRPMLAAPGHWGLRRLDLPLSPATGGHAPDMDAFRAAAAEARAFLLCNPHNPLGTAFTAAELGAMAEACLARDVLIISDEIHADLLFDGRRHVPVASLAPEIARRSITLMSASKGYNIAGLKAAFAVVPDPELRARFQATRLGMVDSVNVLGLAAMRGAYAGGLPWLEAVLPYLQANRDHLVRRVARDLPGLTMQGPDGTFLAWLDARGSGLADPATHFLETARVALSDGAEFGAPGFLRLNFGCARATLDAALDRMAASLPPSPVP